MSTEQNKTLVRRLIEDVFNRGNMGTIQGLFRPFVESEEFPPGTPAGKEGVKQMVVMLHSAFPDFKATVEDSSPKGIRW